MATDINVLISTFINEYAIFVIIAIAAVLGISYLYKMMRNIPKQVDYVKVFHENMIRDENLNIPDKNLGMKYLYRGEQLLGKIISFSTGKFDLIKDRETVKSMNWDKKKKEAKVIYTITFKRPKKLLYFRTFLGRKEILKYTEQDTWSNEGDRLVFPEYVSFTSLGKVYMPINSYEDTSRIVQDDINRQLNSVQTNLYAGQMQSISAQTPEMAHQLSLKRLEIEKIKAEKQMKQSFI